MSDRAVRIALVQTRTPAQVDAALAHVAPLVREAAARGARLIATPEVTNVVQKDRARLAPQLKAAGGRPGGGRACATWRRSWGSSC